MRADRIRKLVWSSLFALLLPIPLAGADPIPANRQYNWTYAGVPGGIPNRTTICAQFVPGATAAAINSAIASCKNGVVALSAGTFTASSLNGPINLYNSNVTLRGAGAGQTILTGANIVNIGNGDTISLGTALTGGGTQGSTQFTVASTANLSVGSMIEIDRDDDTTLVVNTGHQSGGTRNIAQMNVITAISGSTITVRNPLIYNFSTGNPAIRYYFAYGVVSSSGIENMTLNHTGFTGGYNSLINYCDSCWLKGVESFGATGVDFTVLVTVNMEVRDSFIHDGAAGPNNGGLDFWGNYTYGVNSNAKVENNIFNKSFPAVELSNSSSAFYLGYNYEYGTPSISGTALVTWSFDNTHAPFNIMNLWEGNIGEMWGADSYFGGSGYTTALRNYFTGYNPNYGVTGDAVEIDRLAYYYNVVGNVLGSTNQATKAYSGCSAPAVYRLGMPNLGNCSLSPWDGVTPTGGYPDPKVSATLLRWGNYDYFNKATQYNPAEIPSGVAVPTSQTIPNSYYYASQPSWWPASIHWPPIGPDVTGGNGDTSGHVNMIPAQVCWNTLKLGSGGQFNAASCYGSAPASAAPVVTSASVSGMMGQAFSYQIIATNSPTSFSASGLPAGLSMISTTGLISGTPTAVGVSSVTINATNAKGTGTATLQLTIAAPAPAITSSLTASGTVGQAFDYQITGSNSPTSFGASSLPPGLSVNTAGLISGTPTTAGSYGVTISATNAKGTGTATLVATIGAAASQNRTSGTTSPISLFSPSSTPAMVTVSDSQAVTQGVELGMKFSSSTGGTVTALRFYKGPQNVGTHTVHLWSASGTLLASATSANETASGWQTVQLATPVTIAANTTYVASYHTNSYYSVTRYFFSSPLVSGTLMAPASSTSGGNGVYTYGSAAFPTSTYEEGNYYVDVVFSPTATPGS